MRQFPSCPRRRGEGGSAKVPLQESLIKLKNYTGEALEIVGQTLIEVIYQNKTTMLPLQILKRERNRPLWKEVAKGH